MKKPMIQKEYIKNAFHSKYIKVFDLNYLPDEGADRRAYYDATRRDTSNLVALMSENERKRMLPDAVSLVVVLKVKNDVDKLCLTYEYRYPVGEYLLSVPAGLIDDEDTVDCTVENAVFTAARRELKEEMGIELEGCDTIEMLHPVLFSSPGMTDESNALVKVTLNRTENPDFCQEGALGGECFDGIMLVTKEEAKEILETGRDQRGNFYSVYTALALYEFMKG